MKFLGLFSTFLLIQICYCVPSPAITKGNGTIALTGKNGGVAISLTKEGISGSLSYAGSLAKKGSSSASAAAASATNAGAASTSAASSASGKGVAGSVAVAASLTKQGLSSSTSYSTSTGSKTNSGSIATSTANKSGTSTASKKCPRNNEIWTSCNNNACQKTCANYKTISSKCRDVSKSGCICNNGYTRNWLGDCVKLESCFNCEGNETWTDTENDSCQRNCETFGLKNIACKPYPTPGCICEKGYLRNKDGVCVLPCCCENNVCPDENEQYSANPPTEVTCEHVFSGEYPPPEECTPPFNPKCICKEGYVRREDGLCVLPENCCLDPNAIPVSCPYLCPGNTCEQPEATVCGKPCREYPKGCQCKTGYTRISVDDPRCVLIENCCDYTTPV